MQKFTPKRIIKITTKHSVQPEKKKKKIGLIAIEGDRSQSFGFYIGELVVDRQSWWVLRKEINEEDEDETHTTKKKKMKNMRREN